MSDSTQTSKPSPPPNSKQTASQLTLFAEGSLARTSPSQGGAGMGEGTRSGLWSEYARLIGELRPRYVIVENVSALLGRGLDRVLGDLAQIGYDAEWHCIPAAAVGAPHRRDRIWIVAHPTGGGCEGLSDRHTKSSDVSPSGDVVAHAAGGRPQRGHQSSGSGEGKTTRVLAKSTRDGYGSERGHVAHAEGWGRYIVRGVGPQINVTGNGIGNGAWEAEPNVGRVANGVPARVDRLKSLGNAVVPQIPELIGRAILSAEAASPQEE
jgi:DNA (cytosine-5)-methyltransferase 1